ncbi:MAG: hypothetical protein RIR00_45 [Pseudomonadota bacterium]|jgi:hypothetical protein
MTPRPPWLRQRLPSGAGAAGPGGRSPLARP